jgi:Rrf2 family nitric oxide-sensitive transcriptional repressor
MKLNRSTSHAIRILVDCARADGGLVKVADLSERLGITMQNAFKIVHLLSRAELVTAVRGRYGGVRLTRAASAIRVGDVVRAMESTDLELEGGAGDADLQLARGVNAVLDDALEAFIAILDQHTLADLASGQARAGAPRAARTTRGPPSMPQPRSPRRRPAAR